MENNFMVFEKIFVEEQVKENPFTLKILQALNFPEIVLIGKIEDVFGRVKKPYLQKRTNLNLFIGKKEGELIKKTPNAYGFLNEKHYFFVHSYNCVYECEYCYLQGYFSSPDIVFFVNHEEILAEIERLALQSNDRIWFHAGEFNDSLALSGLTCELETYVNFFRKTPNAFLELRTKSVNIKQFLKLEPLPNVIVSFSLSPEKQSKKYDLKTPCLALRLKAIKKLAEKGFLVGLHFDPIIYDENFAELYKTMITETMEILPEKQLVYVSLGVVRFTKEVFFEVQKNYPKSDLLASEFVKSFDNKIRYNKPQRLWMLKTIKSLCVGAGISEKKIYLCMEE
ncbi:hypothetical protein IT568_02870 [bacterium]|nr:hypothetical protein [bacterium]